MDLNTVWFLIVGILMTGYAVLDGFDLGVGVLHLFVKKDEERRTFLNAIGPVWDGNEVWLVTGGGALLAVFPDAYATACSGLYMAFIIILLALIFRGVAIEFRSKEPWPWWRSMWDMSFSFGSVGAILVFGLAIGNIIIGLPLDARHHFVSTAFQGLISPYPLLVAFFVLSLFTMHGAIYLYWKTHGPLQEHIGVWILRSFGIFLVLYMGTTLVTLITQPQMLSNFRLFPAGWVIVGLTLLAIANIPRTIHHGREFQALVTSSSIIVGTFALFGLGLYPRLLPSSLNPAWSLTIYNAASSPQTLKVILWVAAIGMPFVLGYTLSIYWLFREKVKLDHFSY